MGRKTGQATPKCIPASIARCVLRWPVVIGVRRADGQGREIFAISLTSPDEKENRTGIVRTLPFSPKFNRNQRIP